MPFHVLRDRLSAVVPKDVYVLGRTQFAFDEDCEAFADVAVLAPGDDFWLVILEARNARFRALATHLWRRFAREIWFVDAADRTVARVTPDGAVRFLSGGDTLATPAVPDLKVTVGELFA